MDILIGKANSQGESCRVYQQGKTANTLQVSGNFAGCKVYVDVSTDDLEWQPINNGVAIEEAYMGQFPSLNGWVRARVEGGIAWKYQEPTLPEYRRDTFVPVDYECVYNGQHLKCVQQHITQAYIDMNLWEDKGSYTPPAIVDNSGSTLVHISVS